MAASEIEELKESARVVYKLGELARARTIIRIYNMNDWIKTCKRRNASLFWDWHYSDEVDKLQLIVIPPEQGN